MYFTSSFCGHGHVDYTIAKGSRCLGFISRNSRYFPQDIQELLYESNGRPVLECACSVWDPPTNIEKDKIEKVQNRAVRYALGKPKYGRDFSVTRPKQKLKWDTLEQHRAKLRLKLFHRLHHSQSGIPRETYIFSPHYVSSRVDHIRKVPELPCKIVAFSNSFFFPKKTFGQWNQLPSPTASILSNNTFLWLP